MSFRTEDTWEHLVHAKSFLAKFVSIWVDIVRVQLVCMYMDASIPVVDVLALKVKKSVSNFDSLQQNKRD